MTEEDPKPDTSASLHDPDSAAAAKQDPDHTVFSEEHPSENPPRKRSKVSRACDACRRKKIRCNAEYSSTLHKVTKICDNCVKNTEVCAFSRIPLKRGPSKGYIRDLQEKLDSKDDPNHNSGHSTSSSGQNSNLHNHNHLQNPNQNQNQNPVNHGYPSYIAGPSPYPIQGGPHLNSHPLPSHLPHNMMPIPNSSISGSLQGSLPGSLPSALPSALPHHQPLPFPQKHLKVSQSPGNGNSPPIILPPLVDLHSKILPPATQKYGSPNGSSGSSGSTNPSGSGSGSASFNAHTPTTNSSNPSSPRSNSINGLLNISDPANPNTKNSSPPIQGPFWKVPYEMPAGPSRRSSITLISNSNGNTTNGNSTSSGRRRSSIDSISSTSTNGSRLASLKPSVSINSEFVSDSESEDFYSIRSNMSSTASISTPTGLTRSSSANLYSQPPAGHRRQSSQTASPRNSVSSLSSLSGRMNKNLHIQPTGNSPVPQLLVPASQFQPVYPPAYQLQPNSIPQYTYQFPQQPQPQQMQVPHIQPQNLSTLPSLSSNLRLYYTHFHSGLPILPFDSTFFHNLVESTMNEDPSLPSRQVLELFSLALHNLINFKKTSINDNISIISRILALYPFNNFNINPKDSTLILFFSALVLSNYSILLNGEVYALGIAISISLFNDFKVLENFLNYEFNREKPDDYDDIKLYLPKLFFILNIIDDLYSLSFGVQKSINHNELVKFLKSKVAVFIPREFANQQNRTGLSTLRNSVYFYDLILIRDNHFVKSVETKGESSHKDIAVGASFGENTEDEFSNHFVNLVREKYELISYLFEINQFLKSNANRTDLDEIFENLTDYNLKLIRLVKKLASSIVNFANFISTSTAIATSRDEKSHNNSNSSLNEISTRSSPHSPLPPPGQLGKLAEPNDPNSPFPSASVQMNPLLNITLGQLFKLIKLNKLIVDSLISLLRPNSNSDSSGPGHNNELLNRCVKINNDLSISFNLLSLNLVNLPLGSVSVNLIKGKINSYLLNFALNPFNLKPEERRLGDILNTWGGEFRGLIAFVEGESVDGWY